MKKVLISKRAYLSMLAEVYERVDTETGGILLGHREGDTWYVLESVEPGPKSIFTPTYFEYDDAYVTYRANKLSRLYKYSIELLGLWHRHPSLMKTFSSTDDGTNKTYSDMLNGAISGIVTLGNGFEITMYYVPINGRYEKIDWVVDDEQIPEEYLSYYDVEYYKKLINEEAQKVYSFARRKEEHGGDVDKKYTHRKSDNQVGYGRAYTQEYKRSSKGFLSRLIEKFGDAIYDMFEETEDNITNDNQEQNLSGEEENSDVGKIFDTIEPEIAYLQKLEADGKIKCSYEAKKDSNGKDGLILTIIDMRQPERYYYRIIFFISKGRVMVKEEDGTICPYTEKLVSMILGGSL